MWRYLLEDIADLPRDTLKQDKSVLMPLKETLCAQAASTMGVDEGFIQSGLVRPAIEMLRGRPTQPVVITNMAMATSVTPFRQLLAIHIIEAIEPER